MFPDDPTQHADADGDGLGDNQSGTDTDPSLNDFDNDGYTDDEDTLPKLASPGDKDNDGVPDGEDAFPDDFRESKDSDGDGEGDNADSDDDNDGWSDVDEIREGRDPYNSASQPVEEFEVVLRDPSQPRSMDLIGVFTECRLAFGFLSDCSRVLDVLAGSKWSWIKPRTDKRCTPLLCGTKTRSCGG